MNIVIAGTRGWTDYTAFAAKMDHLTSELDLSRLHLYHGACSDCADEMADHWAFNRVGVTRHRYLAQWDKHGWVAGPLRNRLMLSDAQKAGGKTVLVAFWDGRSPGTKNCIETAREKGVRVVVVDVGV